ncbi:hypothetical protein GCM10022377_27100 [Zhihengliuella alba]|uniref:Uncharacterized protein n=1 Tax=Zhihengliuella alba TaxID=547018 RepID=A0ABP7DZ72_9MICC
MRQPLIVFASVIVAFVVSFVADTYFGVPFWRRLITVVCVSLLMTTVLTKWSAVRRQASKE